MFMNFHAIRHALLSVYLSDMMFPDAEKVILIIENLNTHKTASIYNSFPPAGVKRIIKCLEIHYTPKHRNWLDMVKIEFTVITRQCLSPIQKS